MSHSKNQTMDPRAKAELDITTMVNLGGGIFDNLTLSEIVELIAGYRKNCDDPKVVALFDQIIENRKKQLAALDEDPNTLYLSSDMELLNCAKTEFSTTWLGTEEIDDLDPRGQIIGKKTFKPDFGVITQPVMLQKTFIRQDVLELLVEKGIEYEVMFGQGLVIKNAKLVGIKNSTMRELIAAEVNAQGEKRYQRYEGERAWKDFPRKMRDGHGIWRITDPALEQQFIESNGKLQIEDDQWGDWEYHLDRCGFLDITYDKISYEQEANIFRFLEKQNLIPKGYQIVTGLDDVHKGYRYALLMPIVEVDDYWLEDQEGKAPVRHFQKTEVWSNKIGVSVGYFQLMK